MSLNSDNKENMGSTTASGNNTQQLPRLGEGGIGYAAWRPNADVALQRHNGAEGIHIRSL